MTVAPGGSGASSYIEVTRPSPEIAQITIARPEKRNALNQAGWSDLGKAFRMLAGDRSVRSVILTGTGGAFCAGDDILAFRAAQADPEARQVYWDSIMDAYASVSEMTIPVIAAVDGPCYGGGCTLALRCDFRIAGPMASFAIPPAKLGLVYPADSTLLLTSAVGITMAKYMLYSGERLVASQAVDAGLALPLGTGEETAIAAAISLAEKLTRSAPLAIQASKLACDAIALGRLPEFESEIRALSDKADRSNDYKEGAAAFAGKRQPVFTGT